MTYLMDNQLGYANCLLPLFGIGKMSKDEKGVDYNKVAESIAHIIEFMDKRATPESGLNFLRDRFVTISMTEILQSYFLDKDKEIEALQEQLQNREDQIDCLEELVHELQLMLRHQSNKDDSTDLELSLVRVTSNISLQDRDDIQSTGSLGKKENKFAKFWFSKGSLVSDETNANTNILKRSKIQYKISDNSMKNSSQSSDQNGSLNDFY